MTTEIPATVSSKQVDASFAAHKETARMHSNGQLIVVSDPSTSEISTSVAFTNNDESKQLSSAYNLIDQEPQAKKGRQYETSGGAEEQLLQPTSVGDQPFFLLLPFDILLEILSRTNHPGDLLAVARTCKNLCRKLTDPSAYPLWRGMRRNLSLPDPAKYISVVRSQHGTDAKVTGVSNFSHEPAYAAFVFDGGGCEVDVNTELCLLI